jgi:hypothetical protein
VVEPPDQLQVLPAGELLLDRRRLPGQADQPPHRGRLPDNVAALDKGPALVRDQQRGKYPHGCGLASAVRAQHTEDRPPRHRQIDPAQRAYLSERLDQALHQDGRP